MGVDISRALSLTGPDGIQTGGNYYWWLAEQASTRDLIVEVGSWVGGSARAMADNTAGTVVCVDPWAKTVDMDEGGCWKGRTDPEWLWKTFQRNMEGLDNVVPMRMTSMEGARWLRTMRFDMIFLDAAHDFASVEADVNAWRPLLAPGGLFCGHDWAWPSGGPHDVAEFVRITGGYPVGVDSLWIGA